MIDFLMSILPPVVAGLHRKEKQSLAAKTLRVWSSGLPPPDYQIKEEDEEDTEDKEEAGETEEAAASEDNLGKSSRNSTQAFVF